MDKMTRDELLRRVQALSFAKVETELYLDCYPESKEALAYYKKTLAELDEAMEEYQNKYGPLFASGVVGDKWSWVDNPWPWQIDTEDK